MIIKEVINMKKLILSNLLLWIGMFVFAQNANNFQKMVDFLPPAPNASAIIKHAELTLNKNTGSPTINIPLFNLKGNKLSAGVSIGYSSTGIKVDEIASRAGMGWALNAGGVVTRTVRGWVDENTTRVSPFFANADHNCGTFSFLESVATSNNYGGYDSEPDLFNFNMNGISGSFVYDAAGLPVLIPAEKYKIEKQLGNTAWDFRITTTDGIKYYFGGSAATEKTKRNNTCGKSYDQFTANAWYLIKIEHPNGEVINLSYTPHSYTYESGVNETRHWAYFQLDYRDVGAEAGVSCPSGECPAAPAPSTCVNLAYTQGVILSSIYNTNSTINFVYTNRSDCGDKLISSITQVINGQTAGIFNFTYIQQAVSLSAYNRVTSTNQEYTPYLTELKENSPDLVFSKTHKFIYNDPGGRAPRFAYAQDHWGYFNGKNNTTFLPKLKDFALQLKFPQATANREPDSVFAKKGMLTKIIYPTGGIDYIEYESNDEWGGTDYDTYHEFNCNVTGTGTSNVATGSTTFTIDRPQIVELDITSSTSNPVNYDPIHMQSEVVVSNASSTILSEPFNLGSYIRFLNPSWDLAPGTYTLTYKAKGAAQTTNVKLKYYPKAYISSNSNKIVGGVRVKRVMTGNPAESPVIKRYYYAPMNDLARSSLAQTQTPVYNKDYENAIVCQLSKGGPPSQVNVYCHLIAMYSGSLVNLFNYSSGSISYGYVVESIGENFEGGAVEAKFYAGGDARPYLWWGNEILGATLSNQSSPLNGKISEEIVYKKPASGPLFPIKKTQYSYLLDSRAHTELYGYTINKKYGIAEVQPGIPCGNNSSITLIPIVNSFDVMRYDIDSYWGHLEYQTETLYDENGANPVTTISNSFFDNEQHFQQTRSEVLNSKLQQLKTTNQYPGDITGNQVYTDMVAKNIITPLVHSTSVIVGTPIIPLSEEKINYGNVGNNNFVPVSIEKGVKGNSLEVEGTIDFYDTKGNILQFTNKAGIVSSIIWGYDYRYPVAQIISATYANAIAQLTGSSVTALQTMDGATLRTEINRIRTNIPTASVTTYTYKPMAGVNSITDPNNKTNTYDYDSFNRLLTIKDQDGNAVKKNEYVYTTPDAGANLHVFFNDPYPKTYSCQTCEPGYVASAPNYTYVVPLGKYYSLIDQATANGMAAADTYGQEYVNKNATCINYIYATCTGTGYKVVNCICELGTKLCENTQNNGGGSYTVSYRYQWSDGTISATLYTETITCTGVDKKMINCTCETGLKVCDNVQNNGGGSYTVTYHYLWSDASTSSPITETITCTGVDKKMINCNCETGIKLYTASVMTTKTSNNGCGVGQWKCTYHYRWSDWSISIDYTECSAVNCID